MGFSGYRLFIAGISFVGLGIASPNPLKQFQIEKIPEPYRALISTIRSHRLKNLPQPVLELGDTAIQAFFEAGIPTSTSSLQTAMAATDATQFLQDIDRIRDVGVIPQGTLSLIDACILRGRMNYLEMVQIIDSLGYGVNGVVLRRGFPFRLVFPWAQDTSKTELTRMFVHGMGLHEVTQSAKRADGVLMNPISYFNHDNVHFSEMNQVDATAIDLLKIEVLKIQWFETMKGNTDRAFDFFHQNPEDPRIAEIARQGDPNVRKIGLEILENRFELEWPPKTDENLSMAKEMLQSPNDVSRVYGANFLAMKGHLPLETRALLLRDRSSRVRHGALSFGNFGVPELATLTRDHDVYSLALKTVAEHIEVFPIEFIEYLSNDPRYSGSHQTIDTKNMFRIGPSDSEATAYKKELFIAKTPELAQLFPLEDRAFQLAHRRHDHKWLQSQSQRMNRQQIKQLESQGFRFGFMESCAGRAVRTWLRLLKSHWDGVARRELVPK